MADDLNVAAELAGMRGAMDTGFAKIQGQLALLVQSGDRHDRDLTDLDRRVEALEARRVPLPLVAAVSGAVSAIGTVVGIMVQ